ncbi:MAG TPA: Hpt domain-containing protein [Gemmatimonadaceae bacterium]|nr:Hpt domain-containing protein [Gemmatimonadaceae bacterium]
MSEKLTGLWAKTRDSVLARVAVIESATDALRTGTLDADARAAAERAAHKLAGVAGTFGYWEAAEMAREAESAFEGTEPIPPMCVTQLSEIAVKLHAQLMVPPKSE